MSARIAALLTLLLGTSLIVGTGPAAGEASPWTQTVTQQALDSGFLTRLPPAVSVAFGLTKPEEGTEVRQLLTKEGHRIRTFNVSVANGSAVQVRGLLFWNGTSWQMIARRIR